MAKIKVKNPVVELDPESIQIKNFKEEQELYELAEDKPNHSPLLMSP